MISYDFPMSPQPLLTFAIPRHLIQDRVSLRLENIEARTQHEVGACTAHGWWPLMVGRAGGGQKLGHFYGTYY